MGMQGNGYGASILRHSSTSEGIHLISTPSGAAAVRLAIIDGGPRAVGLLVRVGCPLGLPWSSAGLRARPLHIDVIDPHMSGSGRIWRADESPLLLMSSRAQDVTMFTDESVRCAGPVRTGPSLAEWAAEIRAGRLTAPTAGTQRLREIEELTADDFASRRVQALYLEWCFGQVLAALPSTVQVTVHRAYASAIHDLGATGPDEGHGPDQGRGPGQGHGPALPAEPRRQKNGPGRSEGHGDGPWQVDLENRDPLHADLVLLAAGHTDARPDAERHELAAFARRHGLTYVGPAQAADADIAALAPGQEVIVRGMGLGLIDLMALLTEGRGGRFEPDPVPGMPGRLRYLPSGLEPVLRLGSRRGVPYHSKVDDEGRPAGPRDLAHVTDEQLRAREDADGRLDFRQDVVPLIAAEISRAVPSAPRAAPGEELLAWLDDPLGWLDGQAGPRGTRDAVVRHIENDLRSRTTGDTTEARALFQVLLRISGALVDLLPASRLRGGAHSAYPRWWHSLFSFVDSGPPPHRLHQLLALERAGVVGFIGPRAHVSAETGADGTGRFVAHGGGGVRVEAGALLDAFLPHRALADSANPLLRNLVRATGAADVGAGPVGRAAREAPGRLEIDARQRVVAPDGSSYRSLWATGPWTSELPVGAFARPRTNAACFRRNDALAAELLAAVVTQTDRPPRPARTEPATGARAPRPVSTDPALRPLRIGILGPGKLGTAVARTALRGGLEVDLASRLPDGGLRARVPGAAAVRPQDLAARCDLVILAVPLHAALALDPAIVQGAVVVDVTNPWGPADAEALAAARERLAGSVPDSGSLSTSELLAEHLGGASVAKTLHHIGYHDVEDAGRPAGDPGRRAIAAATDDPRAEQLVTTLLGRMGFDAVQLGSLAQGRHLEPGAGLFGGWATRAELEARQLEAVRAA